MEKERIIQEAGRWILARLTEGEGVSLGSFLGTFCPQFRPEYIVVTTSERRLYPPSVSLRYIPGELLLSASYYYSLSTPLPPLQDALQEVALGVSLLLSRDEGEVLRVLDEYLSDLLSHLFRGRRITLFTLGDMYVVDEGEGQGGVLTFVPGREALATISRPFSAYPSVPLREGIDFPELEHLFGYERGEEEEERQQFSLRFEPEPSSVASSPEPLEESSEAEESVDLLTLSPPPAALSPSMPERKQRISPWWGLLVLLPILLLPFLWVGRFGFRGGASDRDLQASVVSQSDTLQKPLSTSSVEERDLSPKGRVTVKRGDSLNKYALQYYGEKRLWVYIYMSNDSVLGDANNIPLGADLVIPNLELYDLLSDSELALKEAEHWEWLILSRRYVGYQQQREAIRRRVLM